MLLPRLDEQGVEYPNPSALSTKLLEKHEFVCGEQAMMAFKAWLFEQNATLETDSVALDLGDVLVEDFVSAILDPSTPSAEIPDGRHREITQAAQKTHLLQILQSPSPRTQKGLGRKVPNFSPEVWDKACMPIVVAASIARAESDEELRKIYSQAAGGQRKFVEGSPVDTIWGVGLRWDDPKADVETEWRGRNLLGRCHDEAAAFVRDEEVGEPIHELDDKGVREAGETVEL